MKHRIILILMLSCVLLSAGILVSDHARITDTKPDLVEINRIKIISESAESFSDFRIEAKYDFTIVSILEANYGDVLFSTKQTTDMQLTERLNLAISNYDTILDFERNGNIEGKIIIYTSQTLQGNQTLRLMAVIIPFFILCVLIVLYYFYMLHYLYSPFKRLKNFAQNIAAGNLDLPLPMDKDNLFGEFTESFDILRQELKIAKQKAVAEEQSKKELIATLSHDIKTPVSIVRAASELLEINETDQRKLVNIKAIQAKTLEIDHLITDLFSSALDDLSELKINIKDINSAQIEQIITNADLLKKTMFTNKIPECLMKADPLRISQICGNIISNSYKYADTKIEVSFHLLDHYLRISFKDFGGTLSPDDLPMLANKFYRGKNAEDKEGAGLGLYICSKLLERMGGSLEFDLEKNGLRVDIYLVLS
ncbi:MAG: HAMP domain-containing sensor histidine kinase [Lachnospiraceae bacterium]